MRTELWGNIIKVMIGCQRVEGQESDAEQKKSEKTDCEETRENNWMDLVPVVLENDREAAVAHSRAEGSHISRIECHLCT